MEDLRKRFSDIINRRVCDVVQPASFVNNGILTLEIINVYNDLISDEDIYREPLLIAWGIHNNVSANVLYKLGVRWSSLQLSYPVTMAEILARPNHIRHQYLASNPHLSPEFFDLLWDNGIRHMRSNLIDETRFADTTDNLPIVDAFGYKGSIEKYIKFGGRRDMFYQDVRQWTFDEMYAARDRINWSPSDYCKSRGYTIAQIRAHVDRDPIYWRLMINANACDTAANIASFVGLKWPIIFNDRVSADDIVAHIQANAIDFSSMIREAIDDYDTVATTVVSFELTSERVDAFADIDPKGILRMFCRQRGSADVDVAERLAAREKVDGSPESLRLLSDCYAVLEAEERRHRCAADTFALVVFECDDYIALFA